MRETKRSANRLVAIHLQRKGGQDGGGGPGLISRNRAYRVGRRRDRMYLARTPLLAHSHYGTIRPACRDTKQPAHNRYPGMPPDDVPTLPVSRIMGTGPNRAISVWFIASS